MLYALSLYGDTGQSSSVQSLNSVWLWPDGLQHARPLCPSPTPGVHPNPCPLSQWCHPTVSSSVIPFSSCPQSFPASGSFQMSQFFASGGQSIRVSVSGSVLPMYIQDWFPLRLTGLISLQSKGPSRDSDICLIEWVWKHSASMFWTVWEEYVFKYLF